MGIENKSARSIELMLSNMTASEPNPCHWETRTQIKTMMFSKSKTSSGKMIAIENMRKYKVKKYGLLILPVK
jgi:hypothetical protein